MSKPWARNRSIADAFSPRNNSLNFLRLVLAIAVIFAHASQLSRPGSESILGKTTIGTVAVYGFFAISGFLIAGSAERSSTVRYLWQRCLRIVPAFWVCLVVISFGFGLAVWVHSNPHPAAHCGISCYINRPRGPIGYIVHNLWLWIDQPGITNTLRDVPIPNLWDGSLWTLAFEFLCYLLLAALALAGALRHRSQVAILAVAAWITLLVITSVPTFNHQFNFLTNPFWKNLLELVPVFLAGSLLYLYRKEIPDSGWLALFSAALFLVGLVIPLGNAFPAYTLTSTDLTAPFVAYPILWLGMHLPLQRVGVKNDYSYGMYIYAFPVQQTLAVWGVYRWGYWPYASLSVVLTIPFAVASWWGIEKHALKLKYFHSRVRKSPTAPLTAGGNAPVAIGRTET